MFIFRVEMFNYYKSLDCPDVLTSDFYTKCFEHNTFKKFQLPRTSIVHNAF